MSVLIYGDYYGSIDVSVEDKKLYGKILNISDSVVYEGESVNDLQKAFEDAVEDYIDVCKKIGKEPEKSIDNMGDSIIINTNYKTNNKKQLLQEGEY